MSENLGVGVVGAGAIGIRGALTHLSQPDVRHTLRLAAVCDPVPGRAEAAAKKFGVPAWYLTYEELLADPKERAEHVMLVDLARNDLGRVCRYGTVHTPTMMEVERYSHVMHIVSDVQGELRPNKDAFDVFRACFPAGTVSGAPKVRAMEIIEELEPERRGPYAGAVGYFGFSGNMDTCIAIRTMVMKGDRVYLQAGAGLVADSDPAREYEETENKLKALSQALLLAERGLVSN